MNIIYYLSCPAFASLLSIFLLPLYTLHLDAIDYGIYSTFILFISFIVAFCDIGSAWALNIYYFNRNFNRKVLIFNILLLNFIIALFVCILSFIFSKPLVELIFSESVSKHLFFFQILILLKLFCFSNTTISSHLILNQKAKTFFYFNIITCIISHFVIFICLFYFDFKYESLLISFIIKEVLLSLLYISYIIPYVKFKLSFYYIKSILSVGWPALFKTPFAYLSSNADRFILQRVFGSYELAIFNHAYSYRGYYEALNKSVNRVYGANLIKNYIINFNFRKHLAFGRLWLLLNFFISIGVILFSGNIINILSHGKFLDSQFILQCLFITTYIQSYSLLYNQILVAEKRTKYITFTSIITTITIFFVTLYVVFNFNWKFLIISSLLTFFIINIFNVLKVFKILNKTFVLKYYLLLLIMLFVIFLLRLKLPLLLSSELFILLSCFYLLLVVLCYLFFKIKSDFKYVFS